MSVQDDIAYLKRQRDRKIAERDRYQAQVDSNNRKISRLKKARDNVHSQKKTFDGLRKDAKNIMEGSYSWEGNSHNLFKDSKGYRLNAANDRYYKNSLDYIEDSLNNEITRLQNENYSKLGLIGQLTSAINSLINDIRNLVN